ncbi:TOG array regulator of axonemal microtubules protein 1-like isoform X6 [Nerophis ophidion]|uniref:TOG array regulator of axonemal microtubules protein 1-like isoform X6 n=1 Tax=Nerophis ophidion TaxID=159077 RepID=UPI002ADF59A1|nr:TOG array regulator of axonemal microtubules protein 1-like isoform X6 [Nerophis ophidion]
MILGIISQELYQQLLDPKNYQNRTNGVEELKQILSEVNLKLVSSDSIEEFIHFLSRLLDDSNFKVLYGTLQVLNLLIRRLDTSIDKYVKQIVLVALKALGDPCTIARNEYMNIFQQMMKTVAPQQVLDLVIGNLKHKNSRVREDVLNIIIAAMLTHPRKEFNIPNLCFEVAPYLADSKKKVRHAALELFAVFDSCLDAGKKHPLTKAVDMVELNEEAEGLMAAVQARRARRVLPKLSPEGVVEYGLVVPKSGLRCSPQATSGADLDWVMNGGRLSSARSQRTELDCDQLHGYGSLGCLTDEFPSQRRIVSAGKGKNKLPWERLSFTSTENNHHCSSPSGKCLEQVTIGDVIPLSRKLSPETYIPTFSSAEPQTPQTSRRRLSPTRLRRSGSLNLDPDIFKTTNFTETDSGSFLLPSYPLAALPGGQLTPTFSRRHADSSLSMSNTWPNKRESSPQQRDNSPWRDTAGKGREDQSIRCSPRPIRAALKSSSSTLSFRRALNSNKTALAISPVIASADQIHFYDQRSNARYSPQNQQLERDLHFEPVGFNTTQNNQEEDALDMQEMLNSLRSLRNSAAKKRAKVSLSSSDTDQDSQDPVKLDLSQDPAVHTSRMLTSSASENGLSSLSLTSSSVFGIKTSPGSMTSGVKPRMARVPSAKLKSSVSMDLSSLSGLCQRNELSSQVGVVGQRVSYSNGTFRSNEDTALPSPPFIKPALSESPRTLKSSNESHINGRRNSLAKDVSEGVIGRGMFDAKVSSPRPGLSFEQGDMVAKPSVEPLGCLHLLSGDHRTTTSPDEMTNTHSRHRDKIRHRVRQMLSDSPTEESTKIKHFHPNGSTITFCTADLSSDGSPIGPTSPLSPPGPHSPIKCLTPPHQPSPPTVPPNPQNLSRVRRAPSLTRTRPSLSHSSEDLSSVAVSHKKNSSQPPELCLSSKPDQALVQSLDRLSSECWEKKIEGLTLLRSLAQYHSDVLQGRLHDICIALTQEVKNRRSGVSRAAVRTLGDFYTHLQKAMDQELEGTVKVLVHKGGEPNAFIRQHIDDALDCMVQHCTPTRSIQALLSGGVSHLNRVVRKCTAQHLANLVEKVGAGRLLSGGKDLSERIVPAVSRLAQDSSPEARHYGRRMLLSMSYHPDFDKILERTIPSKDLQPTRDTILSLKTKGLGEMPQDTNSARGRRSLPGSGTVRASSLNREPVNHTIRMVNSRHPTQSIADKNDYINHLTCMLGSKDFREKLKGMDQLVSDCQQHPNLVIHSLFPLFDALKARLQESNSKVNQHALESLQKIIPLMKDNLSQVVNLLVPAIVDNHLNSKNDAIYSAAIGAIDALILNLDNILLLQPFCTKAQFVSGKAKLDLVEKVADLVTKLYSRKPQMVEQKALPLLWHMLGTSSHSGTVHGRGGSTRAATAVLCQALRAQIGPRLSECAAMQSATTQKGLNELLRNLSKT